MCPRFLEQLVFFTEQRKFWAGRLHVLSNLKSEEEVLTEGCLDAAFSVEACASYTSSLMNVATIHPQGQVFGNTLSFVQPCLIQLRKDTHL